MNVSVRRVLMKAIICNNCKKVIGLDDKEAIEVLPPQQRQLYPYGKEKFVPYLHYCGKCKTVFYSILG